MNLQNSNQPIQTMTKPNCRHQLTSNPLTNYQLTNIHNDMLKKIRLIVLKVATALILSTATIGYTAIDVYEFDSPQQEAQYRGLIEELRCPKCQNQNLAGSDATIAQDLKQKVYDMVKEGRSDNEIRQYMFDRYGDFISYKPPVRPSTWVLWFFPPILLTILLIGWFWQTKRKQQHIKQTNQESTDVLTDKEQAELATLLATIDNTKSTYTETNNKGVQ